MSGAMLRMDGRKPNEMRPIFLVPDFVIYPEGSVLISMGNTKVLCNVSVEDGVPRWMQTGDYVGGWVTAEYSLLPRSTNVRTAREERGLSGRTQEIRRMIGRSLRASVDLTELSDRTFIVDCDVIQADGGTRTAAITGGYVALEIAIRKLILEGELRESVLVSPVAAISVGVVDGLPMLDLCYQEDRKADVDMNVAMNAQGEYVELQSTAEGATFTQDTLFSMIELARKGINALLEVQSATLKSYFDS